MDLADACAPQFPVLAPRRLPERGHVRARPGAGRRGRRDALGAGPHEGRTTAYFERRRTAGDRQRAAYAARLGAEPGDVALTTSTSEGIGRVLAGLDLGPGDEVAHVRQTSTPACSARCQAARDRRGVDVRAVAARRRGRRGRAARRSSSPARTSAGSPGETAPAALAERRRPGAARRRPGRRRGPGRRRARWAATSTPARARSGCAGRSAPGCSGSPPPGATGWRRPGAAYLNLEEPSAGLEADAAARRPPLRRRRRSRAERHRRSRRRPRASSPQAGWDAVHERAARAGRPARGRRWRSAAATSSPRGETTLVSWETPTPPAARERLAARRRRRCATCPARPFLRASVGAWNDESDLERLLAALEA